MACLPNDTLIAYNEDSLGTIEASQARDHLLVCPDCRRSAAAFRSLDSILASPSLHTPPARLIPRSCSGSIPSRPAIHPSSPPWPPAWSSWSPGSTFISIFPRSSLIQALQLTANGTSGWLANIIKAISVVYNAAQAGYKAGQALLNILSRPAWVPP